jgi:hypothetical protein
MEAAAAPPWSDEGDRGTGTGAGPHGGSDIGPGDDAPGSESSEPALLAPAPINVQRGPGSAVAAPDERDRVLQLELVDRQVLGEVGPVGLGQRADDLRCTQDTDEVLDRLR